MLKKKWKMMRCPHKNQTLIIDLRELWRRNLLNRDRESLHMRDYMNLINNKNKRLLLNKKKYKINSKLIQVKLESIREKS
jgi:hypothetical protein